VEKNVNSKETILDWLDDHQGEFTHMADQIWEFAEVSWREFKSSKLQADYLADQGFDITWDLAGITTAFMAEWGNGKPIIGFAGEYDALQGLSQKVQPSREPRIEGAPGHGCGHNLLGTAAVASATVLRYWLESSGTLGTVRYYGCPAEEGGAAKTFMARAGLFNDLDVAFNFHPASLNYAQKSSAVGVNNIKFRFHGRTAHAGGEPHLGRSALDAVELMNVGVNYLREHVTSNVRIHYAITHGGDLPNVVPAEAEVWYYIRAHLPEELEDVTQRVRKIAEGAAMMTGTSMEEDFQSALSSVLSNHYLADLQYQAMQFIGPTPFTPEDLDLARQINDSYPPENVADFRERLAAFKLPDDIRKQVNEQIDLPLLGINLPSFDEDEVRTGSTDVGDMSWNVPLSMLRTTCFPTAVAGHDWGTVASSGSSIGHKGMMHAAGIMALAAMDCFSDHRHIESAHEEFTAAVKAHPYHCPMPSDAHPPYVENPERREA
jgi:aminobenzoyl-glutamate utilization protein B